MEGHALPLGLHHAEEGLSEEGRLAILTTEGLTREFGGLRAVDGVDFRVAAGEIRAIIGPNGAGKSTFFNLLTGRIRPTAGRIRFRERDITGWPPHRIAQAGIAIAFQIMNILPRLTAYENVRVAVQARRFPNPLIHADRLTEVSERAREILEEVGLRALGDTLAANLSHGDQRHLELGIALASDPALLLLDEPTAGMSPEETQHTVELIRRVATRKTVIIVEHDMEVVMSLAHRITVLDQGRILAEGVPDVVRQNAEVQRVYLREL